MSERRHQSWRVLVATAELTVAGFAVWLATLCWASGINHIVVRLSDGTELASTHYEGDWIAGSIAFGLLAALFVVDAARQILLAVQARRRKPGRGRIPPTASVGADRAG